MRNMNCIEWDGDVDKEMKDSETQFESEQGNYIWTKFQIPLNDKLIL